MPRKSKKNTVLNKNRFNTYVKKSVLSRKYHKKKVCSQRKRKRCMTLQKRKQHTRKINRKGGMKMFNKLFKGQNNVKMMTDADKAYYNNERNKIVFHNAKKIDKTQIGHDQTTTEWKEPIHVDDKSNANDDKDKVTYMDKDSAMKLFKKKFDEIKKNCPPEEIKKQKQRLRKTILANMHSWKEKDNIINYTYKDENNGIILNISEEELDKQIIDDKKINENKIQSHNSPTSVLNP